MIVYEQPLLPWPPAALSFCLPLLVALIKQSDLSQVWKDFGIQTLRRLLGPITYASFTSEGSLVSDRHPNAAPLCAIKVLFRGALLLLGLEDYIVHTSHPTLGNSTSQPRFTDTEGILQYHVVEWIRIRRGNALSVRMILPGMYFASC